MIEENPAQMIKRRIYVASSWRNSQQPEVVDALRSDGHQVYDFRNPAPGNNGFRWTEINPDWQSWTPQEFAHEVVSSPIAAHGFAFDKAALDWCDTCVLVLPSGRSAHLEAGYAAGQGKRVIVLLHPDKFEPELMYLLCDCLAISIGDVLVYLRYANDLTTVAVGWRDIWASAEKKDTRPRFDDVLPAIKGGHGQP